MSTSIIFSTVVYIVLLNIIILVVEIRTVIKQFLFLVNNVKEKLYIGRGYILYPIYSSLPGSQHNMNNVNLGHCVQMAFGECPIDYCILWSIVQTSVYLMRVR